MKNNITDMQDKLFKNELSVAPHFYLKGTNPCSLTELTGIKSPKSSAFDSQFSLNPLVAACAPILMAANKMRYEKFQGCINTLHDTLISEIKIFEEKARKLSYRSAIILAGRYFLCSFIDEIILQHECFRPFWQKQPLLDFMQNEATDTDRFFEILERASQDPKDHIDLIELGFLVLALGYQGKYKYQPTHQRELENIKDNLYSMIEELRLNLHPPFYLDNNQSSTDVLFQSKKPKKKIPHFYIASVIFLTGSMATYVPYHIHLNRNAKPVERAIQLIAQNN